MTEPRAEPRVLVVDDHLEMAETLAEGLRDRGYDPVAVGTSSEAARRLRAEPFDALVTDLRMPDIDGLGLLQLSRSLDPSRPVIVMTAYSAVDTAVESIRQGAYHYLTKPFKLDELALFLGRALEDAGVRKEARALRAELRERFSLGSVIGKSAAMRALYGVIERIKDAAVPVLIMGETGTGKGLIARALHAAGARADRAFVAVNCASLPEALLESELFGHVKGAFTGATTSRAGLFSEADGGALLLDEIGEMTPVLQAKLLHVLESGTVRAVGAEKERHVDVRVLAATHRDLRERVRTGAFREDLFYRLDGVTLEIPALRHRRDDIPLLVEHFLATARERAPQSPVARLSAEAMARMLDHAWPGNVRELAHVVERLVLLGRAAEVQASELPPSVTTAPPPGLPPVFEGTILPVREVQRRYAAWALEQMGGQKTKTAERLGVDLKTLSKWLSDEDK
jgi:two-component system response regulator HydG